MNLPPGFITTITNTFGADGERFIADLPVLIDEASQRWGLTNVRPVANLSYNFVAFAESPSPFGRGVGGEGDGNVALKIGVPNREFKSEMAALRLFNGKGACRLIDLDEEKYMMLLERLKPGAMLSTLKDDEEATRIAAEVMKKIWRPVENVEAQSSPKGDIVVPLRNLIQLPNWFKGLKRLRDMFGARTGPLNEKLVERVEASAKDFFAENHMPVLMHGDFHHFNILSSEREWLVIDPKGVIGPAAYEVGPFMMNPWGSLTDGISRKLLERRVDILHEELGFERERIIEWSLAHAILSAWWGIEDKTGWEYSMQFAELIAEIK